jgi:hypothetical protein
MNQKYLDKINKRRYYRQKYYADKKRERIQTMVDVHGIRDVDKYFNFYGMFYGGWIPCKFQHTKSSLSV